jgi:hypothetical protein
MVFACFLVMLHGWFGCHAVTGMTIVVVNCWCSIDSIGAAASGVPDIAAQHRCQWCLFVPIVPFW